MRKQEFLAQLHKGLSGLPQSDIEERLAFYNEMIEDHIEEGLSEEEAVSAVGSVDEIVTQITADIPLTKTTKEKIKSNKPNRRLTTGEIILLVLGSPLWLSLGIAAIAVILSLYISLWAVIVSLWAVFASVAACSIGGVLTCIFFTLNGLRASGVAMLAAGILCAGLSIFLFFGCKTVTNGVLILTKKMAIWIKNCFIRKEEA